ncbi:MAG: hypothetical protein ABI409_14250 [Ramlibacter sp.]
MTTQPRACPAPPHPWLLFAGLGILGLQRSRSGSDSDLGALLLGLVSCLVGIILLLVALARIVL